MSTPALVALNVLQLLTGGEAITVAKHRAPEKEAKTSKDTVTRLFGGVVIVSKK